MSLARADNGLTGRRNVIDVEEWAEIRRLHRAEGMGVKAIVRRLGMGSARRRGYTFAATRRGGGRVVS